jgi:hypothetical protein
MELNRIDILRENNQVVSEDDPQCKNKKTQKTEFITGPPNSFKLINKYGRVTLVLCATTPEEKTDWINEFTYERNNHLFTTKKKRTARESIVSDEKKNREEAVKKSASKAEMVKQLLTAQYESDGSTPSTNYRARMMQQRASLRNRRSRYHFLPISESSSDSDTREFLPPDLPPGEKD